MKKLDIYLCTAIISFILSLGLCNREILSISNYFLAVSLEANLLLQLSVIFLIIIIICIVKMIYDKVNKKK